ncbi:MAG: DNA repair protein RadC [Patescibacteria group bacterium]|jgi:DNA repair protein RadC|nr:DNA repair protein RadC [Patescibacteria group bacterium]
MNYKIKDNNIILVDNLIKSKNKKYEITRVRDLPKEEKPREKLLKDGISSLSSAQLLAIILNTGTKKEEVMNMTSRLLKEYGEKGIIYQKNPEIIEKDLDIPLSKACQLVSCFEIGRRFYQKKPGANITIRTAKDAFEHLKDMSKLHKEQFRGLYLNSHYQLIHDEVVSIGTLDSSLIAPREVFKPALEYSAAAIIIAHNHPSGSLEPSDADIEITKNLIEAGKIIGIEVLDHILISADDYKSIIQ